jgi:putative ATP-binding cassette transporter
MTRFQVGERCVQILSLAREYWGRRESASAWVLFGYVVAVTICTSLLMAWFTDLQKQFFDTMTARDAAGFRSVFLTMTVATFILAIVYTSSFAAQRFLLINWRRAATNQFVGYWMRGHVAYRIERDRNIDNADQRIADDVRMFCEMSLDLLVSLLSTTISFFVFGRILWQNAGDISFEVGSFGTWTIHGYIFYVAVGWGIVQILATHLAGHKIAGITIAQQKAEADFRFGLAKARESAEQVALYRGDATERDRFRGLFEPIRTNWFQLLVQNVKLTITSQVLLQAASIVPFLASAPKVMSGEMSVGTMMQNNMAFAIVLASVAWVATVYPQLVVYSAVVQRLVGLRAATQAADPTGIDARVEEARVLAISRLQLALPNGTPVACLGDAEIRQGERVLLSGPTGAGKSTLLRAIAGLWPFGRGRIVIPSSARLMILPQKSYIAEGTLKDAIVYPRAASEVSDEACRQALDACELGHFADRLHESHRWGHLLSGGEQQKLAFARALLYKPDILFLDEATSALDEGSEARLYTRLCNDLPNCTIVSVAHKSTVERFHDRRIEVSPAALAPAPA